MQFGRYFEEFEVGAIYKHWPGKTVTEYDDHLFCLITMNHHPLHLDAHYARDTTDFGPQRRRRQLRLLAAAGHVGARRVGQGDRQPRGRVAAPRQADLPRRHDLRRDDGAGQDGVVVEERPRRRPVETIGYKQDGTVVCIFRRKVMVPKRSDGEARGGEQPGGRAAPPPGPAARLARPERQRSPTRAARP